MKPDLAVSELEKLKTEANAPEVRNGGQAFESWKAKVRGVMSAALSRDDHIIQRFDKVRYTLSMWTERTPSSAWDSARQSGIRDVCGLIDAAIYQLQLSMPTDELVDERAYDPELWEHIKGLVEVGDWGKVPANVTIFAEDKVRIWAGDPKDSNGDSLVGKGLWARALGDGGELRLGARKGEWEGWRGLGMGLAQAIGNVDRHHIRDHGEQRRYAIGVLGLASLLLTQMRHEHQELTIAPELPK